MKIVVTGGAGFIGSHVVDALIDQGSQVAVVDNLSTGFERNINRQAKFYRLDINSSELKNVFEREKPQAVVHLAAQTVVTRSIIDPVFDAGVNIVGSLNVISNCVTSGVKKIVYSSSCALYGKPEYLPVDEKHPVAPLSPYGVSKHTVEHYLFLNYYLNKLSYTVLRFANVYGPRQNPQGEGGVVAIFAGKMLSNEQPTIYGAGDKSRDYINVADIVRANLLAIESPANGIYNIGTGRETLDQQIFDLIAKECHYSGLAKYADERPGEIKRMVLDITRAQQELKWTPRVSIEEGITDTILYYRSQLVAVAA